MLPYVTAISTRALRISRQLSLLHHIVPPLPPNGRSRGKKSEVPTIARWRPARVFYRAHAAAVCANVRCLSFSFHTCPEFSFYFRFRVFGSLKIRSSTSHVGQCYNRFCGKKSEVSTISRCRPARELYRTHATTVLRQCALHVVFFLHAQHFFRCIFFFFKISLLKIMPYLKFSDDLEVLLPTAWVFGMKSEDFNDCSMPSSKGIQRTDTAIVCANVHYVLCILYAQHFFVVFSFIFQVFYCWK